jgi:hypothetical protein
MTDEPRGWRAIPPALSFALVAWFAFIAVRLVLLFASSEERFWSARLSLTSEGVATASYVLALVGSLELAGRVTGRERLGVKIAAGGFGFALVVDAVSGLLNFDLEIWRHEWVGMLMQYLWFSAWLVVPVGLAAALWHRHRALAIGGLLVALVTDPPPVLAAELFEIIGRSFKSYVTVDSLMRLVRLGVVMAMVVGIARGTSTPDRKAAASGLRSAARALWLLVISAVVVVLFTLMAVGGRTSKGAVETLKLALVTAAVVKLASFVLFGLGVARAARASIAELPRWPLVVAAGGSLWCAGVAFGQLPFLYRQLYKGEDSHGRAFGDWSQALALAMPFVVIAAAALVAIAIGVLAARRAAWDLHGQAQGKGVGFVVMNLAGLAITHWMVPKAESMTSLATLMLLAAAAGLIATVMLARLCALATAEIEREASLPTASVVSAP